MPKLELSTIPVQTGTAYPAPHAASMAGRSQQRLGDAAGLTQFGANRVRLEPGAMSSLRHWHEAQDEFLVVIEGALVLADEQGETPLAPGDCCAFPAGDRNGHHVINRSDVPGSFVVIGTRTAADTAWYPDLDMKATLVEGALRFTTRDGRPICPEDAPPEADFTAISECLTRALLTGDADLYASISALPQHNLPRNAEPYRLADRAALDEDFALYVQALRLNRVTDIFRVQKSVTRPAPDRTEITAEVHLLSGALRIVDPFVVRFTLVHADGAWRIARIESALAHIRWTLGKGSLPESGRFET